MVDLHTHSSASDGALNPGQLIDEAAKRGLKAIALTDHDTLRGLEEAGKEAESRGIALIPGIELEISWELSSPEANAPASPVINGEFHLLGLGIRRPSQDFLDTLGDLAGVRERRNLQILDRMREAGINADYKEVLALAGGGSVGRPHFAALLIGRKLAKNQEQAFNRYLGKGKPFYVPKAGLEFRRAVELIRASGGIAVLAHPMSLYVSWGRLPDLMKHLADMGLDGIEAWHPTAKVSACKRLENLGKSLGLAITAGSDFHGAAIRPDRKLGFTAGNRKIDDEILAQIEALKEYGEPAVQGRKRAL
ncbi:phosphatase [Spirochaetia bacterium]|nr:phosphatase [Spirochaetia bacterium]